VAEGKFGRPDADSVREFHVNADTDVSPDSIHHTIGPGFHQAASGQHTHDGSNSPLLLEGVTIAGSKGGNTALASVISALVKLGASDATT
jgi:hypothetical protein